MTNIIISDGKKLNAKINAVIKTAKQLAVDLHVTFVSALWHVAKHGDIRPLNRLFQEVDTNTATAMKLYVRRAHAIIGNKGKEIDGLHQDALKAFVEAGTVLAATKVDDVSQFKIVNGPKSDQAKALVTYCEDRFINPDGEVDKYLLDRNNIEQITILDTEKFLKSLIRPATTAEAGNTEKRVLNIHPKAIALAKKFASEAESLLSSIKIEPKAERQAANKRAVAKAKAPAKAAPAAPIKQAA